MRNLSTPAFALVIGMAALAFISLPAAAAGNFSASAFGSPPVVTVKDPVSLTINITNGGNISYQTLVVQVFIYPDSATPGVQLSPDRSVKNIGPGQNATVQYDFSPDSADVYSITIKFYNGTAVTANYLDQIEVTNVFEARSAPPPKKEEFPIMLVAGVAVAVVAAAAAAAIMVMRKRKAAADAKAAEEAAAAYRTPEEPTRIQGKFPKDYYKVRREKLGRLKPTGMTRAGTTILGNIERKETQEASAESTVCKTCCPKCGVEMGRDWKTCKSCGAKRTIERTRELLAKLESAGEDVSGLRNTLGSAEAELAGGNYDEAETYAHDVLDKARSNLKRVEDAKKLAEAAAAEEGGAGGERAATAVEEPQRVPTGQSQTEGGSCFKCGKELKPEWKKCPYCGVIQEGICQGCGRTVKMKWNVCPQCRTDFGKQPPRPACPACHAEMSAEGAECQACKARALLDKTSRLVREVKAKGADVVEAEALLGRGELAIKLKNFEKALGHLQNSEELAVRSRREFRIRRLTEKIEHARSLAKDSAELGADVGESMGLIEQASAALKEERFDEGINMADRAALLAELALDRAVEGKVKEQNEKAKIPISVRKPVILGPSKTQVLCPHCQEPVDEGWPSCPACETPLK